MKEEVRNVLQAVKTLEDDADRSSIKKLVFGPANGPREMGSLTFSLTELEQNGYISSRRGELEGGAYPQRPELYRIEQRGEEALAGTLKEETKPQTDPQRPVQISMLLLMLGLYDLAVLKNVWIAVAVSAGLLINLKWSHSIMMKARSESESGKQDR